MRMPFKKHLDTNDDTNKNETHKDFLIYECDYEPMVKELLDYYSEQVNKCIIKVNKYLANTICFLDNGSDNV